jgi:hypothetical protein
MDTKKEELEEQIERFRRMRIHLVKKAETPLLKKLDEEIYFGRTK